MGGGASIAPCGTCSLGMSRDSRFAIAAIEWAQQPGLTTCHLGGSHFPVGASPSLWIPRCLPRASDCMFPLSASTTQVTRQRHRRQVLSSIFRRRRLELWRMAAKQWTSTTKLTQSCSLHDGAGLATRGHTLSSTSLRCCTLLRQPADFTTRVGAGTWRVLETRLAWRTSPRSSLSGCGRVTSGRSYLSSQGFSTTPSSRP